MSPPYPTRTFYNGYEDWWVHNEYTGKLINCLNFFHASWVFDICAEGLR